MRFTEKSLLLVCLLALCLTGCPSSTDVSRPGDAIPAKAAVKSDDSPQRPEPAPRPLPDTKKEDKPFLLGGPSRESGAARSHTSKGMHVERLEGYRTPVEILTIPSDRCPEAVTAVMLPEDYDTDKTRHYPLVIAFGGAGECARPPAQGALAWVRYYKTDEAALAAGAGRLTISDFRGLATDKEIDAFNRRLERSPYTGVILACPSSPPLSPRSRLEYPDYESFIMKELIPELQSRYRTDPHKLGIDGVSMGGARSMYYGFKYPAVFSSVGSVQGAFGPYMEIYRDLLQANRGSLRKRSIQLVTSDGDVMARSVEQLSRLLKEERIPHKRVTLTGPHDYIFNQGPGALALLMFHNQALSSGSGGPVK